MPRRNRFLVRQNVGGDDRFAVPWPGSVENAIAEANEAEYEGALMLPATFRSLMALASSRLRRCCCVRSQL